jgi:uncharacterized protein (DUF1800 family)
MPVTELSQRLAAASAVAAALSACGGGGESAPATAPPPTPAAAGPGADESARFLLQAQFSASDAEIAAVSQAGYAGWLETQFAAPRSEQAFDWLAARGYDTVANETRYYDNSYPGDYAIWKQLFTAPDAVRQRVALALSEFFVVSLTGIDVQWRSQAIAHYWDQLVGGAFGNWRTLLEDMTLNPAMGVFLNTKGNRKEDSSGRQPDENYGREVMQLFSIGLVQLNLDGTPKLGSDGQPQDTYGPSDVSNLARVFTGYDFDNTGNVNTVEPVQNRTIGSTLKTRIPMVLTASNHSTLAATFLGVTVPANTPGAAALKTALDTLFNHPNVGPFFGRQMIQRLVTSAPSAAYVARVTAAFNDNGAGVRGDLKAVWRAILLDPEARSSARLTEAGWGKVREPMLRLVQWGRSFGLASARGSWKIGDLSNTATQLGQSPLRSPSVFNFYRPGYVPAGTALAASHSTAPEFQLVNETTVAGYLNYLQGVVRNGLFVNAPDLPQSTSNVNNGYDLTAPYTAELALVLDVPALVARLNRILAAGQLSAATVTTIVNAASAIAVTATSTDTVKLNRIAAAVLLVLASPEYLVQK